MFFCNSVAMHFVTMPRHVSSQCHSMFCHIVIVCFVTVLQYVLSQCHNVFPHHITVHFVTVSQCILSQYVLSQCDSMFCLCQVGLLDMYVFGTCWL